MSFDPSTPLPSDKDDLLFDTRLMTFFGYPTVTMPNGLKLGGSNAPQTMMGKSLDCEPQRINFRSMDYAPYKMHGAEQPYMTDERVWYNHAGYFTTCPNSQRKGSGIIVLLGTAAHCGLNVCKDCAKFALKNAKLTLLGMFPFNDDTKKPSGFGNDFYFVPKSEDVDPNPYSDIPATRCANLSVL